MKIPELYKDKNKSLHLVDKMKIGIMNSYNSFTYVNAFTLKNQITLPADSLNVSLRQVTSTCDNDVTDKKYPRIISYIL